MTEVTVDTKVLMNPLTKFAQIQTSPTKSAQIDIPTPASMAQVSL